MRKDLFLALHSGELKAIENMREQESPLPSERTFEGDTALHIAALQRGDLREIENMREQESTLLSELTYEEDTALHIAAREGHKHIVEWILQKMPDLAKLRNTFKETSLVIACKYGHKEIVEQLLDPTEPFRSSSEKGTPSLLHAAVHGGNVDIVKAILDYRAEDRFWHRNLMRKKDKKGRCAIHVAAIDGNWDIIKEFISRMPDCLEIRSSDHKSVFLVAVEHNQYKIVKNLVQDKSAQEKARLVSRDRDRIQNTALHLAAQNVVSPKILDLLLSPEVEVNTVNEEGMTPLDMISSTAAAEHNPDRDIIQKILSDMGVKRRRTSYLREDSNVVNTQMVVASLIGTVTFAAMFTIPGGIEEDKGSLQYGGAKLTFHKHFRLFIFSDTLAFTASLSVVSLWLAHQHLKNMMGAEAQRLLSIVGEANLSISIIWTMVAFVSATITVLLPTKFESLKEEDNKLQSKYNNLLQIEIFFALALPLALMIQILTVIAFQPIIFSMRDSDKFKKRTTCGRNSSTLWRSTFLLVFILAHMLLVIVVIFDTFKLDKTN